MNYHTKTKLILPFHETWMVTNGGRDEATNRHLRFDGPQNQLYGYDFRGSHSRSGKNLEDYEIFGARVLSPGEGVIIQIIDGSRDVLPGQRDRSVGVGNAIIIDHKNGEFSLVCHLKYNSITVKTGTSVEAGDQIGLCGNTGNTSEPHIHFSLQDGPLMHTAKSLPAQFTNIIIDQKQVSQAEPIRGQMVSNS